MDLCDLARPPSNPTPKEIPHDHESRALICAFATALLASPASAIDSAPAPRAEGWLVKSYRDVQPSVTRPNGRNEQAALKAITAKRTAADVARIRWWATGGPAYRWNEIILDEMQESFVTLPMSARHLALFHTAIDDAMAAAAHSNGTANRSDEIDAALRAAPRSSSSPSQHAAAATAAAAVLGYLFPGPRREVLRHGRRGDADAAQRAAWNILPTWPPDA